MKKITLIIMILGMITISNAQIEIKELKLTPEIEEKVVTRIKDISEGYYSNFGIKNSSQLENLHTGRPIPKYNIVNEKLEHIRTYNVSRMSDGDSLSLRFENAWNVPVMSDGEPLFFVNLLFSDSECDPYILTTETANIIAYFHNYEHKDLIIGSVSITPSPNGMDHLIIRKDNQDIFVQIYDEVTDEYFKNEYRFSELFNHLKELNWREKEARNRYYEKIANKSELELTPEITEMLINQAYSSHINDSDKSLSDCGIKDRSQLENFDIGKPIPLFTIVNENLTFTGCWDMPVMSDGEPFYLALVKLDDDGQYRWAGDGYAPLAKIIHNYEHKDLIIGPLKVRYSWGYLIIRKDNQDVFVQIYDDATHQYDFKNEYSFSELLNFLKK